MISRENYREELRQVVSNKFSSGNLTHEEAAEVFNDLGGSEKFEIILEAMKSYIDKEGMMYLPSRKVEVYIS
ncbi:hypothetical protein AKJ59_00450 [candidate division MSBL1 archaeon SCGC-AAA385M02]|uniref:Uncharacterized protein n=1 Tax=candidate division MSBL1 archaeon SCGC-AAA385M02 TaxID=1698287 RepID=A0A133VQP9_9EURY|nr:hypothetical protein AKJ59_00450 [candidate division MSBL1 archaeon SCGC-AAA385M02]